ncbi:hypothetical protein L484_017911 [Morus notabilis]|uniref:Uncharacterized protein n=1 Tax=Morus notabilis TaxID=981085 RepID=W9RJQ6_9ROSA|nr:hypothetical protein L484_017911 [Morus notabilis]
MAGRGHGKNLTEGQKAESALQPGASAARMPEDWMQTIQALIKQTRTNRKNVQNDGCTSDIDGKAIGGCKKGE